MEDVKFCVSNRLPGDAEMLVRSLHLSSKVLAMCTARAARAAGALLSFLRR